MKKSALIILFLLIACTKKEAEIWYCPMHKDYQTDRPGDCPICGMRLVKKDKSTQLPKAESHAEHIAGAGGNPPEKDAANTPVPAPMTGHAGHGAGMPAPAQGTANALIIPVDKQQMLGVLTAKPQIRKLAMTLRLPAQVAYDPDLYTALVEYRQIRGQGASMPEGISGAVLANAAKLRVRQLGLSDDEIRQFASSDTALSRLLTGHAGGKALISLQVSEGEIGLIRKGQSVTVVAGSYADKKLTGQVTGIGTLVDAKRRVFTVRALVADGGQTLHAQMFVSAEIALDAGKGLSVPRSAVFNTGKREIVFVKRSESEFVPVDVKILGGNDDYAIVSGIGEKDEIVTSSAFLLDSEARIKIGDYK